MLTTSYGTKADWAKGLVARVADHRSWHKGQYGFSGHGTKANFCQGVVTWVRSYLYGREGSDQWHVGHCGVVAGKSRLIFYSVRAIVVGVWSWAKCCTDESNLESMIYGMNAIWLGCGHGQSFATASLI